MKNVFFTKVLFITIIHWYNFYDKLFMSHNLNDKCNYEVITKNTKQ